MDLSFNLQENPRPKEKARKKKAPHSSTQVSSIVSLHSVNCEITWISLSIYRKTPAPDQQLAASVPKRHWQRYRLTRQWLTSDEWCQMSSHSAGQQKRMMMSSLQPHPQSYVSTPHSGPQISQILTFSFLLLQPMSQRRLGSQPRRGGLWALSWRKPCGGPNTRRPSMAKPARLFFLGPELPLLSKSNCLPLYLVNCEITCISLFSFTESVPARARARAKDLTPFPHSFSTQTSSLPFL